MAGGRPRHLDDREQLALEETFPSSGPLNSERNSALPAGNREVDSNQGAVMIEAMIEPAILVKHRKPRTAYRIAEGTDKTPHLRQASRGFYANSDAQGQQHGD